MSTPDDQTTTTTETPDPYGCQDGQPTESGCTPITVPVNTGTCALDEILNHRGDCVSHDYYDGTVPEPWVEFVNPIGDLTPAAVTETVATVGVARSTLPATGAQQEVMIGASITALVLGAALVRIARR